MDLEIPRETDMPLRAFPESFNWERKAYPEYGWHHTMNRDCRLKKKENRKKTAEHQYSTLSVS